MYYFTSRFRITETPKENEKILESWSFLSTLLKPRDLVAFTKDSMEVPVVVWIKNGLHPFYYDDDGKEKFIAADRDIAIIWRKNKNNNYVKIYERED